MHAGDQHKHREAIDESLLVDFVLGRLPDEELERVARQTANCPPCQAVLDELDALEDSILRDLRTDSEFACESTHPELDEQIRLAKRAIRGRTQPLSDPAEPERVGDFRIVRRIAHGGMGDIYEAIQEPLNRRVVVKTIRRGIASEHARQRFLREQHVLAKLHETHIVPIFAAGEEASVQYFAMPYIEGASLNHILRTAIAWPEPERQTRTPRLEEFARAVVERTAAQSPTATSGPVRGSRDGQPDESGGDGAERRTKSLSRNRRKTVGDWLILRSLRSKMCLSPSSRTVLGQAPSPPASRARSRSNTSDRWRT